MNKVYKVIYSKVKQCNVVVSEIAKSHGRHTKSSVAKKKAALAAATLTLPGLIAVETMPTAEAGISDHNEVAGGKDNTTGGTYSTIAGGSMNSTGAYGALVAGGNSNVATSLVGDKNYEVDYDRQYYDECSTVAGGYKNTALGDYSTLVGGSDGVIQGRYSTGIAGGSTGARADHALAMGYGAVVTDDGVLKTITDFTNKATGEVTKQVAYSNVSTAIGYQATANQAGTISFGHDKGDVSGYTVTWQQDEPDALGVYHNSPKDGTHNRYDLAPTVTANTYDSSYYNRLVKLADGINGRDAVTMRQAAVSNGDKADTTADNIGANYKVVKTDESGNVVYDEQTGLPTLVAASDDQKKANESAWGTALGTGKVESGNDQLVTGGTVYDAIKDIPTSASLAGKADVTADNIGKNLKNADGTGASDADQKANAVKWGEAIGLGAVNENDDKLMTSKGVYSEVRPSDGNYIHSNSTTAQNLTALDTQVKNNADAISNITYTAGNGITLDNKQISAKAGTGITVDNNGISIHYNTSHLTTGADGALDVVSNGAIADGNTGLVTGATVFDYLKNHTSGSAVHFFGVKDSDATSATVNYNGNGASGDKTVAIGSGVSVTGDRSNSVGYKNTVAGTLSDVYGNGNTINEGTHNAVVLGNSNKVGSNSVAIGTWDKEKATNSVFIGGDDVSTTESGSGSPFTGWEVGITNPDGSYTVVDGGPIHEATSDEVGDGEELGAKRNPFFGDEEEWNDEDTNSSSASAKAAPVSAFSSNALFSDGPSFDIGNTTGTTDSTIDKVTVVGKSADASGVGSVSLGYGAKSDNGNIAIGYNSQATAVASEDKGYLTGSNAPKSYVSIGDGKDDSDTQYRRITNVADGSDNQDAVTVAQLRKTANADASNIGANLKQADGKNAATDDITANEKAWGAALGTGNISTPADMLVTDTTIKAEVRPANNGEYVKADQTTAQNLTALDSQVKTNAETISSLSSRDVQYDMNEDGKTVNKGKITLAGGTDGTTISNVKDGTANTDAVNVRQLKTALQNQTDSLTVKAGWGIDIDKTDGNTIRLRRNLGRDMDSTDKATLEADATKNAFVLGGRVGQGESKGGQTKEKAYGAFGLDSVIVGGADNTVNSNGNAAVVIGGLSNEASAQYSAVLGGNNNDALGTESTVAGGFDNNAYGVHATLTGGSWNKAYGEASSVFGGSLNDVAGKSSVAVGGYGSHVYGDFSVGIAGGSTSKDAAYALAAGNEATVTVQNGTAIGYQSTANKEGTIAFGHDKDDVYYTSTWSQKATEKDGHYYDANNQEITKEQYDALQNADLTFNDYSKTPTVTANTYSEAGYNRLVKVADGQDDHDVVVMEQLKPYTKTDASNIGKNFKKADGTTAADAADITANENAWGAAIGTGSIADQNGQLVTGGTVYTALQNKADIGMGNITDAGKTVIRGLAKEAVTVIPGNFTTVDTISQGNATAYRVNVQKGNIASGDGGLVTGGQVYDYIAEHPSGGSGQTIDLSGKADISAGNVGSKFTKYSDAAKNDTTKQAEERKVNEQAWGTALGTGNIAAPEGMLITDTAVNSEVRLTEDGTYVKKNNTTVQNLSALDTQLGKVSGSAVQYDTVKDGTTVDTTKLRLAGKDGTTISNVKDGEADDDAVNVKQLKEKIAGVTYKEGHGITFGNDKTISAVGGTGITVNTNGINVNLGKHLSATGTNGAIDVNDSGTVTENNAGLVTGGTVYTALHDALNGGTDDVVFGHDGKDGKDGSIGLVGPKGKDGADGKTTTIIKTETGAAGVNGKDGKDGITRIYYYDKDDTTDKHTVATLDDGMKYAGDVSDAGAADAVANVKLDHQLKLSGTTFNDTKKYNADDWTSDNIAVVSSAVDSYGNAVMNLKLAKDLKDLNSSEYTTTEGDKTYTTIINGKGLTIQPTEKGSTTSTSGPSITIDGIDAGGKAITNVGSILNGTTYDPKTQNGYAATLGDVDSMVKDAVGNASGITKGNLDKKANIAASNIGSKLKNADGTADATDEEKLANENDWGAAIGTGKVADPTKSDTNDPAQNGSQQLVTGGTVYTAIHDTLNGGIDNVVFGHDGKDGTDGSIGLVGPKGKDGADGKTTTIIKTETGAAGVNGTDGKDGKDGITRIYYYDKDDTTDKHTVATLDDGMKYAGDVSDTGATDAVANVKLDHKLKLSGTTFGTDKARKSYDERDWTSDNIAVVSSDVDQDGNAVMNLKLAKDLKNLSSSEYKTADGDTTYTTSINGKGLTIQSTDKGATTPTNGPSITIDGINGGGKAITNIANSVTKNADGTYTVAAKTNAATVGDVQTIVDKATDAVTKELYEKADKTYVDTELGKKADKSYVDTELGKKADRTYVDDQLKTKADADKVYTKDQVYTKEEVNSKVTNIGNSKADKDLSNISGAGKQVIKNTMKDDMDKKANVADMAQKANVNASNIDTSKWAEKLGTGSIVKDDKNLVTGGTVYTAISDLRDSSLVQSDGKTLTIGSKDTATKVDISGQDAKGNKTGRVITGVVSDASDPNSAANVGYVNGVTEANNEQIYRDMNMQYNHVENDISRAAAGSNALAALHPMQEFDPDDKAQFAVGYGHYRNANAGAVGAFYQPDENSMVNFGVSFGNGDAGINAGVTFKFGPGGSGHHALTKTQMAKVINTQAKEIEALKQDNADKDKRIDALEQKMAEILARLDKSQAGA